MTRKPAVSPLCLILSQYLTQSYFSVFSISAVVVLADGTKSPFQVHSGATFEGLQCKVAEKLDCFSVKLTYRLENEKRKDGSTSIQSQEDFVHFMGRMCSLSVPPKTASGKASARVMKPFCVVFENANKAPESVTNGNGKRAGKRVCHQSTLSQHLLTTLQAMSSPPHLDVTCEPVDKMQAKKDAVIAQLQERYQCEKHSSGTVTNYCYSSDAGIVCYWLSMSDFNYWALDVVRSSYLVTSQHDLHNFLAFA